LLLVKKVKLV